MPTGGGFGGLKTKTWPLSNFPSRLQRPAACAILSSPVNALKTTGKSISTPASSSWVLITWTGTFAFSFDLIPAITSLRCSGHIRAERWTVPSGMRLCSSRQLFRVLTMHKACSQSQSFSAMVCHSWRSSEFPTIWIVTRWKISNSLSGFVINSRTLPSLNPFRTFCPVPILPDNTGCVAVQSTTEVLKYSVKTFMTETIGCRYSVGSICASSSTITELTILCSFLQDELLTAKSDSNNWTFVVTIIGASQLSVVRFAFELSFSESKLLWCSSTASVPNTFR